MEIRKATVNDIEAIQGLAAKIWPVAYRDILIEAQLNYMLHQFYSIEALQEQILTKGHQFFIIVDDQHHYYGFAAVSLEYNVTYKLQKLYVLPSVQGKNLGKMLLQEVMRFCLLNGGKRLILNVNRYNKARWFYEKQGFKIIDEVDIDIGNNYFMNDFVMERNL
jgi:GNAT superfamily N-acetyltransferase